MDKFKQAIVDAVASGKTTYQALSTAIEKNPTYVQQFITKGTPRELKERDARTIAELIRTEPPEYSQTPPAKGGRGFKPVITPGSELVGSRDFPVYAAARGGDGHVIVTFDPIEHVKRPSVLEGVKNAYAIYIVGESMVPAFEPGDMALVHPYLPASRDKDVVLYHTPPEGEAEAIVKRLVGYNDENWKLLQYNPREEFNEARADWPICHVIVGKYNRR